MRIRSLLMTLVGGVLLLCGCSSKTECQQACERRRSCAANLNCDTVAPSEKAGCTNTASMFRNDDCSTVTTCDPTSKARAQEYNACSTLNNFCECKSTTDGPARSDILCHRPENIRQCNPPSTDTMLWKCVGCGDCDGQFRAAACSLFTNDCRYFATGCIPQDYAFCDGTGSDALNFLCGYCFFDEAGAAGLAKCDKLGDGGGKSTPADAGNKQ